MGINPTIGGYLKFFFERENGGFRLLIVFNFLKGAANRFRCRPLRENIPCRWRDFATTNSETPIPRHRANHFAVFVKMPTHPTASPLTPNPALTVDLVADLLAEELGARQARMSGLAPGPLTSFEPLDRELGGFLAPGVHTVLAAPGAGKTALCLQIAARCGCPTLYVSAEMRRVELMRRLIARETGEYLGKLRGGALETDRLVALARRTAAQTPQMALFDAQEAAANPEGGGATVSALAARAGALKAHFQSDHILVVIDSVTEWAPLATMNDHSNAGAGEYALAEVAVNGLKNLASVLRCPVLAIAHRHRAAQSKDADRLHGAKGTGRYEYISESVWDMERDQKNRPPGGESSYIDLTLLKNRYGAVGGTFRFCFEGRIQKFSLA